MVCQVELSSMAYVAIFRYDDIEGQVKTNMFALISQQISPSCIRKQSVQEEAGGIPQNEVNNNKKSDCSV